ncbi:FHA domain-containing protein [Microbacterium elymi]|uniref:FHA domain-containing protein n=1 Tax=Microbacterium elymi TaxID=2909587 RepID=A0ABY5NKF2_9MICO|nr:FHA domain-containing protein [Microbacterium elymi]UUT35645.1 hypothetical protein L2X98_20450 [Microbacterium elymi]
MNGKYTPTTTHSSWGSGNPHLIVSHEDRHRTLPLDRDVVRIGSADDVELRLAGLQPLHAEIHHDPEDEYVLVLHGPATTSARHVPVDSIGGKLGEVLRTGARFVLGEWAFVYARDEYADHGLPYGGRQGGEGAHDPHQPERPDYTGEHPVITSPPSMT